MYLFIDKGKYGHNTLYVAKKYRNGKSTSKLIERLGIYDDLAKFHSDPIAWAKSYIEELNSREEKRLPQPLTVHNLSTGMKKYCSRADICFCKNTFMLSDWKRSAEVSKNGTNYYFEIEQENGVEQRFIGTFSLKYRDYQRIIRNEQIERAKKAITSEAKEERRRQSDYKRFITKTSVTAEGELAARDVYTRNEERIADEEKYDGFYCVATNLEDDASEIIRVNRRCWEIEESFRIMKTEFSARPVFLSRDDRIMAHFMTCFLALVVYRYFEKGMEHRYTCSQLLDQLKAMKYFKVQEGYMPAYTRNELTDDIHRVFGARTDYRFSSFGDMKKIILSSKK